MNIAVLPLTAGACGSRKSGPTGTPESPGPEDPEPQMDPRRQQQQQQVQERIKCTLCSTSETLHRLQWGKHHITKTPFKSCVVSFNIMYTCLLWHTTCFSLGDLQTRETICPYRDRERERRVLMVRSRVFPGLIISWLSMSPQGYPENSPLWCNQTWLAD